MRLAEQSSVNRIQVLNWRQHGDDEAYCKVQAFGAGDTTGCVENAIEEELGYGDDESSGEVEEAEDYEKLYYVNDDFCIVDGEEFETPDGRKLRVSITEVQP